MEELPDDSAGKANAVLLHSIFATVPCAKTTSQRRSMYIYLVGQDAVGDLPKKPSVTEPAPDESEASFIEESFVEEEAEQPDQNSTVPDVKPDAEPDKVSLVSTGQRHVHGHCIIICEIGACLTQDKTDSPKKEDEGDDDGDSGKR